MYNLRVLIVRALKIYAILAVISLLTSLLLGNFFGGMFNLLGNLSILEAAVFFIIGGFRSIFHSASTYSLGKLLKISSKEWSIEELRKAEQSGLVYIFVAIAFLLETFAVAFIHTRIS
jgi:hypothetical protein